MADHVEPEMQAFIAGHIKSVAQLELLLLLRSDPGKNWTCQEVASQLYVPVEVTAGLLAEMESQQLLRSSEDSPNHVRYAPATAELTHAVDRLADLYRQRRVTVISLIYSEPTDKLRSFADAFRLRKPKED